MRWRCQTFAPHKGRQATPDSVRWYRFWPDKGVSRASSANGCRIITVAHYSIREAIEQTGARLQYLPPYSPDLSPIERCWSKLKTALRTAQARTRAALEHAIAQALATITASDARSWFHHCGYALQ